MQPSLMFWPYVSAQKAARKHAIVPSPRPCLGDNKPKQNIELSAPSCGQQAWQRPQATGHQPSMPQRKCATRLARRMVKTEHVSHVQNAQRTKACAKPACAVSTACHAAACFPHSVVLLWCKRMPACNTTAQLEHIKCASAATQIQQPTSRSAARRVSSAHQPSRKRRRAPKALCAAVVCADGERALGVASTAQWCAAPARATSSVRCAGRHVHPLKTHSCPLAGLARNWHQAHARTHVPCTPACAVWQRR